MTNRIKKIAFTLLLLSLFTKTIDVVWAEREDSREEDDSYERGYNEHENNKLPVPKITPVIPVTTLTSKSTSTLKPTTAPIILKNTNLDSDHDGIIDNNDKHPGEDDFAFIVNDANNNGIADDLEKALITILPVSNNQQTNTALLNNSRQTPTKPRTKTS